MLFIKPKDNDVMGDVWATKINRVWKKMQELDPVLTATAGVSEFWQYAVCILAKMPDRIVSSPKAMAACGQDIPSQENCAALFCLSDRVHKMLFVKK